MCSLRHEIMNNSLESCEMGCGKCAPTPRTLGKELLSKVNVSLPDAIPCRGENVFNRKTLVEERKSHVTSKY